MSKILNAFVIGGVFGIIGQLFIYVWAAALGAGNALVNPLTMVTMGVLGLVMFLTGIAPKLEERTTMGVTIPISGMVVAIGGVTFGTKMETGSAAAGAKAGAGLPLRVLGTGAAISVVLSAILFFATHGSLEIAFEPVSMGPVLEIVLSFVVGGAIAAIAEAILLATKAPVPVLLASSWWARCSRRSTSTPLPCFPTAVSSYRFWPQGKQRMKPSRCCSWASRPFRSSRCCACTCR